MVDFAETERIDGAKTMEIAGIKEDTAIIAQLKKNG